MIGFSSPNDVIMNRVMGAVQRAVFRLQEPEKLHTFLCELGRKHDKNVGAKVEYIDVSSHNLSSFLSPPLALSYRRQLMLSISHVYKD